MIPFNSSRTQIRILKLLSQRWKRPIIARKLRITRKTLSKHIFILDKNYYLVATRGTEFIILTPKGKAIANGK